MPMKKLFVFPLLLLFALSSSTVLACDARMVKFTRDCRIQDRFTKLRFDFKKKNIDIDEVAEYRVMRLVQRADWEQAKLNKVPPKLIYTPAPATWEVWDQGIRGLFKIDSAAVPRTLNAET